jgi:protein-S-isoprenylcysteine O-methyltransferase Ste14
MPHPTRRAIPLKAKLALWSAILAVVTLSVSELVLASKTPVFSIENFIAIVIVGFIVVFFGGPLVVWFALWWLSKVTGWWDTVDRGEDDN